MMKMKQTSSCHKAIVEPKAPGMLSESVELKQVKGLNSLIQ